MENFVISLFFGKFVIYFLFWLGICGDFCEKGMDGGVEI